MPPTPASDPENLHSAPGGPRSITFNVYVRFYTNEVRNLLLSEPMSTSGPADTIQRITFFSKSSANDNTHTVLVTYTTAAAAAQTRISLLSYNTTHIIVGPITLSSAIYNPITHARDFQPILIPAALEQGFNHANHLACTITN